MHLHHDKNGGEKAFKTLGISELDIDVQPTVEDSPRGDRSRDPDIIVTVGLRANDFREMMPNTIVIEIRDLAKQDQIVREIRDALVEVGWLKEVI